MYTSIVVEDQRRLKLEGLIKRLRSVTLAVQTMPFVYDFLFIITMALYMVAGESTIRFLDMFFYVSPTVAIQFLILSRLLNLCKWHKAACLLPITPQVPVVLDKTVIGLSETAVKINIITIMVMTILLLVAAYKVFFGDGRE